jgi:general secretion pathway protein G
MRKMAFTMIELIFVIVVLGVLAVIAVPRLAATRDDALISRMGSDIMTGSFECAAYVVAKGSVDPLMSNMSQAIRGLVVNGRATQSPRHVSFSMGNVNDCVNLDINQTTSASGGTIEQIELSYANAGGDHLCLGLQEVIDEGKFPIPLKGTVIAR